ncbi:aspartic peptidase domain-containing protein [Cytidiella melzeri]|nr:aspartic peptidase domain-containing protein [Cytidiella melzeri]
MVHWPIVLLALETLAVIGGGAATKFDIRRVTSQRSVAQNAAIPQASFVTNITHRVPRRSSKKAALRQLRGSAPKNTAVAFGSDDDEEYGVPVSVGGESFSVIMDTGSSDFFLAQKGFECFDLSDNPTPEADCFFGSTFDPTKSKTFQADPNKNFNISFADAEFLTGTVGFEDITVGGMTVKHQEFGVITKAAWNGDGITTGLMGLAFPTLTSVFNGTNPDLDSAANVAQYNPLFFTAVQQKLTAPFSHNFAVFSVSLNRGTFAARANSSFDPNLGFLAFGGIAPVSVTSTAVTVPIQGFAVSSGTSELFFYNIDVDSYTFPGSNKVNTTGSAAILDTGTTLNFVPTPVALAYNAAFRPPATFDEDAGLFVVDCDSTAPPFSAVIGGKPFVVDGRDNVIPSLDENGDLVCISGTQDGGPNEDGNIFILGDVFLHNVVATFDIQDEAITLHERTPY